MDGFLGLPIVSAMRSCVRLTASNARRIRRIELSGTAASISHLKTRIACVGDPYGRIEGVDLPRVHPQEKFRYREEINRAE
jgi:hypothetical protein